MRSTAYALWKGQFLHSLLLSFPPCLIRATFHQTGCYWFLIFNAFINQKWTSGSELNSASPESEQFASNPSCAQYWHWFTFIDFKLYVMVSLRVWYIAKLLAIIRRDNFLLNTAPNINYCKCRIYFVHFFPHQFYTECIYSSFLYIYIYKTMSQASFWLLSQSSFIFNFKYSFVLICSCQSFYLIVLFYYSQCVEIRQ